jgi:hypothetical protein
MNTFPLNGTTLGSAIRYATSAGLEGEASMVFIVSENNLSTMVSSVGMTFTVAGEITSQVILTAPNVSMTFTMTGDGLFNNQFLYGNIAVALDASGDPSVIKYLEGTDLMTLTAAGTLKMLGRLAGQVDVALALSGDPLTMRFMEGVVVLALGVTGDLSINPSSVDDDQRTFSRPSSQREFAR